MELLNKEPADIWRMLIPKHKWLFTGDLSDDELIFTYRDQVYFVNNDGSILSMNKPAHLDTISLGSLYDLLAASPHTFDFDDHGIFDYASILQHMGYLIPTGNLRNLANYEVEIVNILNPEKMVSRYECKRVSMVYALYHALLRCHELNRKSGWEYEHEVKSIRKIESQQRKDLKTKH